MYYGFEEHGIVKAGKAYVPLMKKVARRWKLPEILLSHQVHTESSFNPKAKSSAGAIGLMQVMPGTAVAIAKRHGLPAGPLTDPTVNLNLGAAYMRELFEVAYKFRPNVKEAYKLALVGYLAGPRRIREIAEGGSMTPTERRYVDKVIWDFEKTESWSQLKPPAVGDRALFGIPLSWLLILGVGYYIVQKNK